MICLINLKINGEVCSNTGISDFNGLSSRNFMDKTRMFLSAQCRKTVWKYHD